MPEYQVIVTRNLTESTRVTVITENYNEAEDLALAQIENQEDTKWEIDDGSEGCDLPYVTDVSEVSEDDGDDF